MARGRRERESEYKYVAKISPQIIYEFENIMRNIDKDIIDLRGIKLPFTFLASVTRSKYVDVLQNVQFIKDNLGFSGTRNVEDKRSLPSERATSREQFKEVMEDISLKAKPVNVNEAFKRLRYLANLEKSLKSEYVNFNWNIVIYNEDDAIFNGHL